MRCDAVGNGQRIPDGSTTLPEHRTSSGRPEPTDLAKALHDVGARRKDDDDRRLPTLGHGDGFTPP